MPWQETCVMTLRRELIEMWLSGDMSKVELARLFEISRPTVDKWLHRYHEYGLSGLEDKSRKPWHNPTIISDDIKELLITLKYRYRQFGPKKIADRFRMLYGDLSCPADSTVGNILKSAGLVKSRKRIKRTPGYPDHLTRSHQAGEVWNADFKGDVRLGNGRRCYPLTVSDDYSRYLLGCEALDSTRTTGVRERFECLFEVHGVPDAIKTDNGVPFASSAIGGLSQLSRWFIQHGIRPERIEKGKPTQNGRHERMHRTLKEHAMKPPRHSFYTQQVAFERFKQEYNYERSHESLNRQVPGQVYRPSTRPYSRRIRSIEYDTPMTVRRVRHNGEIKFQGRLHYLTEILAKEPIGLIETDTDHWNIYYSFQKIGIYSGRHKKVLHLKT